MKAALITIHGMGETQSDYADDLISRVDAKLGDADAADVSFQTIYYQRELQDNQDKLWQRSVQAQRLGWQWLRRTLLFNFSDAIGLEAGKDETHSSYHTTQLEIAKALLDARKQMAGNGPIVVIAQSLGGQVFSCYLYDAQRAQRAEQGQGTLPGAGIWRDIAGSLGRPVGDEEKAYLRGSSVSALLTTGCPIPVFVAAHRQMSIRPIARPNEAFEWHNYFDLQDVLGWPLQPLSPEYDKLVSDHSINAGNLLTSWNPLSHRGYWSDRVVLDAVVGQLRRAMARQGARLGAVLEPVHAGEL